MKKNIHVLYGGKSVEHEASLQTAIAVINSLDKEKYNVYPVYITQEGLWSSSDLLKTHIGDIDEIKKPSRGSVFSSISQYLSKYFNSDEVNVVFPALHGSNGEDGTMQGFLEIINVPYVGNGVLASALGIDKIMMKDIFTMVDIPQSRYYPFNQQQWSRNKEGIYETLEIKIGYPCYVKPARLGSSVGISRCKNREEMIAAITEALAYDSKIVVEEEIIGREMQISVIGNDEPKVSVVGEFIQDRPFMDYDAKYLEGNLVPIIPANLEPHISEAMRRVALKAFNALNCNGVARVDYFVTDKNEFYVNEVNTMPGFTKHSMTPALWEKTDGTSYPQLIEKLIEFALEAYDKRNSVSYVRRS